MGLLDALFGGGQPAGPGQGTQQPDAGGGISPLAQSLLAGYFAAIGSPKLSGWGGALSRGGLTALDQYNNARYMNAMEQYRLGQAQKAMGGGGDYTPEQRHQAAESIRAMGKDVKGANRAVIEQYAAGVEGGVMDPEKAYAGAAAAVKAGTATHFGVNTVTNQPYVYDPGTDTYHTPAQAQSGVPSQQAAPAQPQQPQQPMQPSTSQAPAAQGASAAQGQGSVDASGDVHIPDEMVPEVQKYIENMRHQGYNDAQIMGELAKIFQQRK